MNRVVIAAALAALTIVVRLHPFLEGNDDGDVGMYVLVARAWLHGILPYVSVWEYKPPGLFALYAGALAVFGDGSRSAASLQVLAAVATTLLLWRFAARIAGERAGIFVAALWACISIENDGLLGDAELLSVPFAAASLLALTGRPSYGRIALAGLLAAGAAQMKLSFVPFAIVPAYAAYAARGAPALAPLAGAFALPFAAEAALYGFAHRFELFYDANVGATLRRVASRAAIHATERDFGAELRMLTPAWELAPLAWIVRNRWLGIAALWLLVQAAVLIATGEYDSRQFVPLTAPLCVLGGIGLDALASRIRAGVAIACGLLAVTFGLHGYFEVNSAVRTVWMRDVRGVHDWRISDADRLAQRLTRFPLAREGAWFVEVTPLMYDRLGITPVTRYPLTSNLMNPRLWPMLGFSGLAEMERIVECIRPRWIVVRRCGPWCDPVVRDRTLAAISGGYVRVAELEGPVGVYRRRDRIAPRCLPHRR